MYFMVGRIAVLRYLFPTLGLGLLLIALFGDAGFIPMNPEAPASIRTNQNLSVFAAKRLALELRMKAGESDELYFERLIHGINTNVVHWFPDGAMDRCTIGLLGNWVHFTLCKVFGIFPYYEYSEPVLALKRRFGFCSQVAILATNLAKQSGFEARTVSLFGHVVSEVKNTRGKWQILDPDYGLFLPYSVSELKGNAELFHQVVSHESVELRPLSEIYANPDYMLYRNRDGLYRRLECVFFLLKYSIPIFLLLLRLVGSLTLDYPKPG